MMPSRPSPRRVRDGCFASPHPGHSDHSVERLLKLLFRRMSMRLLAGALPPFGHCARVPNRSRQRSRRHSGNDERADRWTRA